MMQQVKTFIKIMSNYKVEDILMENNCIYGPCCDCVFTECFYTEEDEFEGMGRG